LSVVANNQKRQCRACRENGGGTYQCGGNADYDPAVDYDDFTMDFDIWQTHVWPILLNGFSGHGLQQYPAMGRGTAEMLIYGDYKTLNMRPFHYERIASNRPVVETAVI